MASSMVQAFSHAGTVRLSRCLAFKHPPNPANPLLLMRMTHHEHLTAMLAAVSAGSGARRSSSGGCAVHTLEVCGIVWLEDSHVHQICCSFHSLRCVWFARIYSCTAASGNFKLALRPQQHVLLMFNLRMSHCQLY